MFKTGEKLHWLKNLYLRYRYGGGCCDVFNVDYFLAKRMIKPLKVFRKNLEKGGGYNPDFATMEDWLKAIDEMIWSFEYLLNDEVTIKEDGTEEYYNSENAKREQKGFELFGKYFRSLWI